MAAKGKRAEQSRTAARAIARLRPQQDAVVRTLASSSIPAIAGFALCQAWNILCVALPDPITYSSPYIDLRWLSLATALVLALAVTVLHRAFSSALEKNATVAAIAALSAAGSLLGPASALFPAAQAALIHIAAVAVGVGFALLPIAWLSLFAAHRDMIGLATSVAVAALFTYPLANILSPNAMNTWAASIIGSALPLASIALFLAAKQGGPFARRGEQGEPARKGASSGARKAAASTPDTDSDAEARQRDRRNRFVFARYCVCLLIIIGAIETTRNLLLGGTALSFYAGVANIGCVALKLICAAGLLAVFNARSAHGVSIAYRIAFLMLLGVVLSIPFLLVGNWFAHTLLDVGSFFFQLVMLMVAYQVCIGFGFSPYVVFGLTRTVWAAGALAGIVASAAGSMAAWGAGLLVLVLGFTLAAACSFVFTERVCVEILSSVPDAEDRVPRFKTRCTELASQHGISERELEVMMLTAKGRSAARVAEDLGVSLATVNSHTHHIYQKLGVHSRQELLDLIEADA